MYSSPVTCRKDTERTHWMGGVLSIETGGSCPATNYYYSGFIALQMLLDVTKIRVRAVDSIFSQYSKRKLIIEL